MLPKDPDKCTGTEKGTMLSGVNIWIMDQYGNIETSIYGDTWDSNERLPKHSMEYSSPASMLFHNNMEDTDEEYWDRQMG
jgi:hypothetical protein